MKQINKIAVIGSGVMGGGIAAHMANAGVEVVLLDVVAKGEKDRTSLARNAVQRLLKSKPAAFTHKRNAKRITVGNLEDDLSLLKDVDWVVEAVLEDLNAKHTVYGVIANHAPSDVIISSNTSTIPRKQLISKLPKKLQKRFLITHFFNPPRYMQLLELVADDQVDCNVVEAIRHFCDVRLGKGVVGCHDSPGFIANRIGCFWVMQALFKAIYSKITVEEADQVMSRPIGVPKTGVFGLLDLIGIDLMPLIAKELTHSLPKSDAFCVLYSEPKIITKMISEGYTGRKGKGGFYRLRVEKGKKIKQQIDLKTGTYSDVTRQKVKSIEESNKDLRTLLAHKGHGGVYAYEVLVPVLAYAASLIGEIADDIIAVDEAMRLGYNWKYGPFELIDRLGDGKESGAAWLTAQLKKQKQPIPPILKAVGKGHFYKQETHIHYFDGTSYQAQQRNDAIWSLAEKTRGKTPVLKNPSAKLWDIGDGIACFEFTSKMNSLDPLTLELLLKSVEHVQKEFQGLVIGNDGEHFSVGANIGFLLFAANTAGWKKISGIIKQGQDTYQALKYAPFPVVAAVHGMALGGGCEMIMHVDKIQAHIETYTGLVEVGVGLVPGWGGCKEMLIRGVQHAETKRLGLAQKGGMFALSLKQAVQGKGAASLMHPLDTMNVMPSVVQAFQQIATAKVSTSAEEARSMGILRECDAITMNRRRLLADAKASCLGLVEGYQVPAKPQIRLPGAPAKAALDMGVEQFVQTGKASAYDAQIAREVACILSGGDTDITTMLSEQDLLDLELASFMALIRKEKSWDRLEHMLETGKPLRN